MAAHSRRDLDLGQSTALDWLLILVGALVAWLFWPATAMLH